MYIHINICKEDALGINVLSFNAVVTKKQKMGYYDHVVFGWDKHSNFLACIFQ